MGKHCHVQLSMHETSLEFHELYNFLCWCYVYSSEYDVDITSCFAFELASLSHIKFIYIKCSVSISITH